MNRSYNKTKLKLKLTLKGYRVKKKYLRACSPVFKKIIDNNPTQHPLIYLRGIQSCEMESILQFMYLGEARFSFQRMEELIKVAKDLAVREISEVVEMQNFNEEVFEKTFLDEKVEESDADDEENQIPEPENEIVERQQVSSDKKSECPECGKAFSQRGHMLSHYRFIHKNINYPCNQCAFKASRKHDLQKHIQSKHEGITYPCTHCDYQATRQDNLQHHISAKHSDNILKCDHCDYQTKWKPNYITHKKSCRDILEGINIGNLHCQMFDRNVSENTRRQRED